MKRNGSEDKAPWIFKPEDRGLIVNDKKNQSRRGKVSVSQTVRYYEQLVQRVGRIKCEGKEWFIWNKERGIWMPRLHDTLYPEAVAVIALMDRSSRKVAELVNYTWQASQLTNQEEIYAAIRYDLESKAHYLINCPSCVLKVDSKTGRVIERLKHKPEFMFTTSLAVDYDIKAEAELFEKTLAEILPDQEDRELALDFATLAFIPHSEHECALINIGKGGNGKGVLFDSIASVLGERNVTSITLAQICHNDRKQVHRLRRSMLNISTETDVRKIVESTVLKQVISGESLSTEQIYRDGYEMRTNCKLCFLTNNLPEFAGGSSAEDRRFRFIHFGQTFSGDKKNPHLRDEIEKEGAGIFRLLLQRLPKILATNELGYGGENSVAIHNSFSIRNNPVKAFVDRCLRLQPPAGSFTEKDKIWKAYRRFCEDQNIEVVLEDKDPMFKKLYEYKPELQLREHKKMIDGVRKRVIRTVLLHGDYE